MGTATLLSATVLADKNIFHTRSNPNKACFGQELMPVPLYYACVKKVTIFTQCRTVSGLVKMDNTHHQ